MSFPNRQDGALVRVPFRSVGGARAGTSGYEKATQEPNTVKRLDSANQPRRAYSTFLSKVRAFACRQSGAAVVEFAVLVPVLLLIVLGTADFGLAMNTYNNETQLANEGARWAVVDRNPGSGSLQEYIKSQGDTAEIRDEATVCISFPTGSQNVGDPVQVTVSVDFSWLPFITNKIAGAGASTTLTGKAVMRLEHTPTNYGAGCTS